MSFRAATPDDVPALLSLQRMFYAASGYSLDTAAAERAMRQLVANRVFGRLLVIDAASGIAGYVAITFGFSLEFGGRDAFVDELFVIPEERGHGLGTKALTAAEETCREAGITALHLEVDHANESARKLYSGSGYVEHARHLMTKRFS